MTDSIVPYGLIPTGVRFNTKEEAEAYLFGTSPTHPIYEGNPGYDTANYEIGLMVMQNSFKRLIPANPMAPEGYPWGNPYLGTPQPKEPIKGHEIL